MSGIDLSIIIVNYNSASYINSCLHSIFKNKNRLNLEVIIANNAKKETHKLSEILKNFKKTKLINCSTNLGFAKANNLAVKKSKGKVILFLNPDTELKPKTLEKSYDCLVRNRHAGIVTCKVLLADGSLDDSCHRGFPTPWNSFCHFSGLGRIFPGSMIFNSYHLGYKKLDQIHEIDSCSGAFMMVKKNIGDKIGWFDEDYFWYGEDIDLCYRIKKDNSKVIFYPNAKVIHYKGVTSGIKKHSLHLSTASSKTRLLATKHRFEVMRIFFQKHYYEKYPLIIRFLTKTGINALEKLITLKQRLQYDNRI